MMTAMSPILVALFVVLAGAGGAALASARSARHRPLPAPVLPAAPVGPDPNLAVQQAVQTAVQAALENAALMQREQLGHGLHAGQRELDAKKELIDSRLDQVREEMKGELHRLGQLVHQLGQRNGDQLVRVEESLRAHSEVTTALASTTQSLREALANPKSRGQWGERMAEDVLRLAGFIEHVNYEKQVSVEGGRALPDYTFKLPKGQVLYMDVKFPLAAYLRYLDAGSEAERSAHRDTFVRDVRLRVKELADRRYAQAGDRRSVDYVLLFLPNETINAFVHEHDPSLVEHALGQKVVMCSPLTLFAFLGVIRQAFDNFMIEQTSDEILKLLGTFTKQWGKFGDSVEKVKARFESVQREFEQLAGPRRRQLERPLMQIEALRLERGLPTDGELFGSDVLELEGYRERGA
jgi:DNA recombination protein RmuC